MGLKTFQKIFLGSAVLIICVGAAVTSSHRLWAETLACSDHLSDVPEARKAWQNGDLVVLTRHAARCRVDDHNCPDGDIGLTEAGVKESFLISAGIEDLGPANTDVYYSPTLRTTMTAMIAIHQEMSEAEWLVDSCRVNFPDNVRQAKTAGRNLLLITHSTCINSFEDSTGELLSTFNAGNDRFYGASLMYLFEPDGKATSIGCILPDNWLPHTPAAG